LDGKGFEPTSLATTIVGQERFGLVTHADYDNNFTHQMSSLDMAGVVGSNPTRPTSTLIFFISLIISVIIIMPPSLQRYLNQGQTAAAAYATTLLLAVMDPLIWPLF
jgi:hypothetical protein